MRDHPDAFADAVFLAEGMDPRLYKQLRRQLDVSNRHWITDTGRQ